MKLGGERHDKRLPISHEEALRIISEKITPIKNKEIIPLFKGRGRILAQDIYSQVDIPLFDNSAVDGYALRFQDLETQHKFIVSERIIAGEETPPPLSPHTIARIFTGATVPQGADSIIMQEQSFITSHSQNQDKKDKVSFYPPYQKGDHIRKKGSEIKKGAKIFEQGQKLNAHHLATLAMIGVSEISVYSPLKIALITTGNEVIPLDSPLKAGKIYNSHSVLLSILLENYPINIDHHLHIKDDQNEIMEALEWACQECDLIITTGGASHGDEDYIRASLMKKAKISIPAIAVKPGKPMMLAHMKKADILALPGNPLAVLACFYLYGRHLMAQRSGEINYRPPIYFLPSGFDMTIKNTNRHHFLRGYYAQNDLGLGQLFHLENQERLLTDFIKNGTGYIQISKGINSIEKGDLLPFIPF